MHSVYPADVLGPAALSTPSLSTPLETMVKFRKRSQARAGMAHAHPQDMILHFIIVEALTHCAEHKILTQ
ncbi:hypothetical protein [Acaryochloris sp. IP29b_bin.137]|uniref:hypothetical protein n=1 Tax=Acaryochloris sp. IP29b_bin.137 TaxID=2969217 RepID=UPI00263476C2|nr:hypothetical protein [Acaryochloris sp. IP29b_bin.137]